MRLRQINYIAYIKLRTHYYYYYYYYYYYGSISLCWALAALSVS
jgi:hypothetical protein